MSQHKQHSVLLARPPKTNGAAKRAAAPPAGNGKAAPGGAPHFLSGPAALAGRILRLFVNPGPHEESEARTRN